MPVLNYAMLKQGSRNTYSRINRCWSCGGYYEYGDKWLAELVK
jgi:hypothetical protein